MKRLMIIALCVSLMAPVGLVGCAWFQSGGLQTAQDQICNAPADVLQVADLVIGLLKPVAATLIPGSAPFIALVTAQSIKDTGCAAISSLNTMISFIEGMNEAKKVEAVKTKAPVKLINTGPLYAWWAGK